MACGSGYFEESPVREKVREELRIKKQKLAIEKVRSFFASVVGEAKVLVLPCASMNKHDRIDLALVPEGVCVVHRGYSVIACTQTPEALEAEFRVWRQQAMSHADVFPRVQ